jgi:hypothetical protein
LLGLLAAEAERTRRWEIMFPEGLTMIPDGNESLDISDSGESVTSASGTWGKFLRRSVGVGGVTVVRGAGTDVRGGVVGVGLAGSRDFSSVKSVRIGGGGSGGGVSAPTWALRPDKLALLLLLLFPMKLFPPLLPFDLTDPRSEPLLLLVESFLSLGVKASFSRLLGETLLFFPLRSSGISSVALDCVAGLESSASGLDSEASALGPLTADSPSACAPPVSFSPAAVDCIRGEDEV